MSADYFPYRSAIAADHAIDFGPGEREHKRRLRTGTESTFRLTYTPIDSWRSQAVRFARWVKRRFSMPVAEFASELIRNTIAMYNV